MIYKLVIPRFGINKGNLKDLLSQYRKIRDKSNCGASTWPDGKLYLKNKCIARISYNGRIWENKPWSPDAQEFEIQDNILVKVCNEPV